MGLLWNTNKKSYTAKRSVSVSVTLSDLEGWDTRGRNLQAHFHNYAKRFDPE